MALESEQFEQEQGEAHDDDDEPAPAHHPPAPPDELFDISTTVDPSYVISLIRKLIPTGMRNDKTNQGMHAGDAVGKTSSADFMEECGNGSSTTRDQVPKLVKNGSEKKSLVDDFGKSSRGDGGDEQSSISLEQSDHLAGEDAWEEYGCVLWDLAASRTHAELMVENLILEVLLAHLMVSRSARITEICLGIIANLACHEVLMKDIVSTYGLIQIIVEQLSLDDTRCLCEACRLLTSGLQGDECKIWAKAIQSEHILGCIIWIAGNTLNPQLLEKSIGMLLAILESQDEVSSLLLPSLMKLGLTKLLISLLASEISTLTGERAPERYSVLDVILRTIEALSTLDSDFQEICSTKELFQLAGDLVKLKDKAEVASSCATAAVLIANMLSDVPDLASDVAYDLNFLQGLLDIFPLASDDLEARSALWNIIARLLVRVKESEMDFSNLQQYVLVLVSKADLIEDDLLDQQLDNPNEESRSLTFSAAKSNAINTALKRIVHILNQWITSKDFHEESDGMEEHHDIEVNVGRLLDCCHKHIL